MNTTLSVKRADLQKKLQARIDELNKQYEENGLSGLREAIRIAEKGETPDDYRSRMVNYHRQVADGLDEGTITLSESGRLSGDVPERPKKDRLASLRFGYGWDWGRMSLEQLQGQLRQHDQRHEENVRPLQAALDLLDMSSDAKVQIDSADYHKLLSSGDRY